jgi:hypothetical protein
MSMSCASLRVLLTSLFVGLALTQAGCAACGEVPSGDDGGPSPTSCVLNSDCAEDEYCGDDGFCVQGLAPGTCEEDDDCEGDDICVFPDGSELGACLSPHACDEDGDCDDGQVCEDSDGDGFRDCIFPGCADDAECKAELGDSCDMNEEPKCVARACVCRDLCGAPCGEDRQCCALPDTTATCIEDPGACAQLECDPGFGGVSDDVGPWSSPMCDYTGTDCRCEELPPLPLGNVGAPHVIVTDPTDDAIYAVAYNFTYGDLLVGPGDESPIVDWTFIDGVPAVSDDTPIVAGPSGPRGGVEAPGEDVGSHLSAAFASDGTLHIVARDATNQTLKHLYGPPAGPFTVRVLDDDGDAGFSPQIRFDGTDGVAIAHVVRRATGDVSELRILASDDATADASTFERYTVATFDLTTIDCEGGCVEGEVCTAGAGEDPGVCRAEADDCPACGDSEACTVNGCQTEATAANKTLGRIFDSIDLWFDSTRTAVFGHDPRTGELLGFRQVSGDLASGTAGFNDATILSTAFKDLGNNPAVVHNGTNYLVASADVTDRAVMMHALLSNHAIATEQVLDDGARPHPSGALSDHAVDKATIVLGDGGETLIAWQDGTDGSVRARTRALDGTLGPAQILTGGPLSLTYDGNVGISLSSTRSGGGYVISAQRVFLADEPPIQEVVLLDGPLACPGDDLFEDNDEIAEATPLEADDVVAGILCGADDDDFFAVDVEAGCTLTAELIFRHGDGDLDLRALDDGGGSLESSTSTSDNEDVSVVIDTAQTVFLRAYGFQDAENAYVLRVATDCGS